MPLPSNSVTLTLAFTVAPTLIADINMAWLTAIKGVITTLSADIGPTDTSLTVPVISLTPASTVANGNNTYFKPTTAAAVSISVGDSLLIDAETMAVETVTPSSDAKSFTLTVSRGPVQTLPAGPANIPFAAPGAHLSGANVTLLSFASPWTFTAHDCLIPWALSKHVALGQASSLFEFSATGSVTGA